MRVLKDKSKSTKLSHHLRLASNQIMPIVTNISKIFYPKQLHIIYLLNVSMIFTISGTHYFMNLTPSLPCENLHPLFLMYNNAGSLAAFGWVFQGRPHNFYSDDGLRWFQISPNTYPVCIVLSFIFLQEYICRLISSNIISMYGQFWDISSHTHKTHTSTTVTNFYP